MKGKAIMEFITALTAVLTAGVIRGSLIYNVELISSPGGPDVTAPVREPFSIICQVLGGDQSNVSSMKWMNSEGKVIREGTPGVGKKENNLLYLTFTDPKPEDSGIYKCAALSANEQNLEYAVNITFYGPEPEFETTFENLTFTEGERAEINCFATGEKPMTYKWYNQLGNDIPEGNGSSIFAISNVNESFLIIREVELHHQGMYTCSANNTHGLSSKLYYIGVYSATGLEPEFETAFENMTILEGRKVEINCLATGEKPITYQWYSQSGDIIPETRHFLDDSPIAKGPRLSIKEMKFHHEGMYTCSANNTHGLSSKLYYLGVVTDTGNETSYIQDIEIVNVSSTSVQFLIPARLFTRYFEVKYRESRGDRELRQVFTIYKMEGNNTYSITNLVPGGFYNFQFMRLPVNDKNLGTWSPAIQVRLLPNVSEIIFRRIEKGRIEFEWFLPADNRTLGTTGTFEITYYTVHMESANYWIKSSCAITIQVPSCAGSSYTISGLHPKNYYQIEVRAHSASGYGVAATQKVYMSE